MPSERFRVYEQTRELEARVLADIDRLPETLDGHPDDFTLAFLAVIRTHLGREGFTKPNVEGFLRTAVAFELDRGQLSDRAVREEPRTQFLKKFGDLLDNGMVDNSDGTWRITPEGTMRLGQLGLNFSYTDTAPGAALSESDQTTDVRLMSNLEGALKQVFSQE